MVYCALMQVPSPTEIEKHTETYKDAELFKSRVEPCPTTSNAISLFLRLEFPDELDEGTVSVLAGVLGCEIGDLVLCFHKANGDLTLLH